MKTLRQYLEDNGIKQSYLCDKLGLTSGTVSLIVNGKQSPSPEQAAIISAALCGRISIADLLYPEGVAEGARMGGADGVE